MTKTPMKGRRRYGSLFGILITAFIVLLVIARFYYGPSNELNALDDADRFELFSLDPSMTGWIPAPGRSEFHNHAVLGSTDILDRATQMELRNALKAGIRESGGEEAACFDPRHGIRVTHGSAVTDFVICFECEQVEVWRDGARITTLPTTHSPQPIFDRVLQNAHVPLAPRPG
jgi:hypothetical protein